MALVYKGGLSALALCPSIALSLGIPALSISAAFSGSVSLGASLSAHPPTAAIYLAALVEVQAQLAAAIAISAPSVSFKISDVVSLQVSLQAAFDLLLVLEGLFSADIGLYSFAYQGAGNAMGAAFTTELASSWPDGAPSSGPCNALVLGAVAPASQAELFAFLGGLTPGAGLVYGGKLAGLDILSPVTNGATAQGSAALTAQLAASASLKVAASVTPPTLAVTATALAKFAVNLRAQLNLAPPSVSVAVSACAKLAASLSAKFGGLIDLGAVLTGGGTFFAYTYAGTGAAMGAAMTTALASTWGDGITPTSSECSAVVLAATDSITWTVTGGFFGGAI